MPDIDQFSFKPLSISFTMKFIYSSLLTSTLLAGSSLAYSATVSSDPDVLYTRSLLPRAPLADIYSYAYNNLDDSHPLVRDLHAHITAVTSDVLMRRMAFALPSPKGGGGVSKAVGKSNKGGSDGKGAPEAPPGLSADGQKAWDQCQAASAGDCGAMRGAFAEMGCSMAKMKTMKPCENKNLQAALKKKACAKEPNSKACKK